MTKTIKCKSKKELLDKLRELDKKVNSKEVINNGQKELNKGNSQELRT